MANEEQVELLKKGVKEWNTWRKKNPRVRIDLEKADLRGADLKEVDLGAIIHQGLILEKSYELVIMTDRSNLKGIDLRGTNLIGANLIEVDLNNANLQGARLERAQLIYSDCRGAYFKEADLNGVNFRSANLQKANLGAAILPGAILDGTRLEGAKIDRAKICETIFVNTNLSRTEGLEEVQHYGASFIDTKTLQLSEGKIPKRFLQGCGLSDWEIESTKLYQPESSLDQITGITNKICKLLTGNPIPYFSCFISYSSKDEAFSRKLHEDLQNKGIRCWFAPEDLKIGDKFRSRIDDAIRLHDKLLIVLSKNSISSTWVEKEVEAAFEKESRGGDIVLFPIRFDDAVMKTDQAWAADIRRTRHIGDFSNWKDWACPNKVDTINVLTRAQIPLD